MKNRSKRPVLTSRAASLASAALAAAWIAFPGLLPSIARAEMSESEYRDALDLAAKKVARRKSLNSQSSNALSSSLIRTLFGRYYQVGDRWEVVSWSYDQTIARMTADPASLEIKGGRGGLFRYEVVSVTTSPRPEVVIHVTPVEGFGFKKPDARVQTLKLAMNDSMAQSQKTYVMTDSRGVARNVPVSPDGIHSAITPLELFPLDVPELVTAESKRAETVPSLPKGLEAAAAQAGFKADPGKSLWFDQDDFFGRPIQALWQHGDPWPAYVKTTNGVSILVRKGAS